MLKLFKKFTLSFLAFLVVFLSSATFFQARAATTDATWYNQDFKTWLGKVDNPNNPSEIFGERYTAAQVEWVIYGLFAFVIHNSTPSDVTSACQNGDLVACGAAIKKFFDTTIKPLTAQATPDNPEQSLASLVFATDRSISGISYVASRIQNLSIVPTAHAQTIGFGFSALQSVLGMWTAFRNIAYGLFVIAAIVLSFMIMFRVKISPQVVISVQSALPKIISALILVTFSYAIAGFLIDLMYVVIGLISLVTAPLIPTTWFNLIQHTPSWVFKYLTAGPAGMGIFSFIILYLVPLFVFIFIIALVGLFFPGPGSIVAWIAIILFILVLGTAIYITLKTVWVLFKTLANILLLTIFAPLQFVAGVFIPNFGFGQWVKNYISNLSVFVVTGVLVLFAWIFELMAWKGLFDGTNLNIPQIANNQWPPLIGSGGSSNLIFIGVSFVLFTMIPKATELVQSFISGKPFAYGSAIGEAFAPAKMAWNNTGGVVMKGLQEQSMREFGSKYQPEIKAKIDKYFPNAKTTNTPKENSLDS